MLKCPICDSDLAKKTNGSFFCNKCKEEIPVDFINEKKTCGCSPFCK